MQIYVSKSLDPFYNIALENWLFNFILKDEEILFLWQNKPSVIIGRAQNPWRECNLDALKKDNVPIVRRKSGGGTVYHDTGNLNYTILSPIKMYSKQKNLGLICSVLKNLDLKPFLSARNDIMLKGHDNFDYKFSGSAFRETKDKSFHHGTILINSDLNKLYGYLHHSLNLDLNTKGVKSFRSKVINLVEVNKSISTEKIIDAFRDYVKKPIIYLDTDMQNNEIKTEVNLLKSWEWVFGKTMSFYHKFMFEQNEYEIFICHGCFESITPNIFSTNITEWLETKPVYCRSSILKIKSNLSDIKDIAFLDCIEKIVPLIDNNSIDALL